MRVVWRIIGLLWLALGLAGCAAPVRVEWDTETELNTAGFNVYRGVAPEGPFDVKINPELIPAAADPMAGGHYAVVDATARPGVTYYYQLQEVETGGAVTSFGPITARAAWLDNRTLALLLGGLAAAAVLALWLRPRMRRTSVSPR